MTSERSTEHARRQQLAAARTQHAKAMAAWRRVTGPRSSASRRLALDAAARAEQEVIALSVALLPMAHQGAMKVLVDRAVDEWMLTQPDVEPRHERWREDYADRARDAIRQRVAEELFNPDLPPFEPEPQQWDQDAAEADGERQWEAQTDR